MECPVCKCTTQVEIDTHSDGFAENIQECGNCGTVWTRKGGQPVLINFSSRNIPSSSSHR